LRQRPGKRNLPGLALTGKYQQRGDEKGESDGFHGEYGEWGDGDFTVQLIETLVEYLTLNLNLPLALALFLLSEKD